jgi:hypothetical protein
MAKKRKSGITWLRLLVIFLVAFVLLFSLAYFGPRKEEKKLLFYSPVWSPDGKQVAYVKRFMHYTYVKPFIKLPFYQPSKRYSFFEDKIALAVNNSSGDSEKIIKRMALPKEKENNNTLGTIEVRLAWFKDGWIQYAITGELFDTPIDTGNYLIRPDGSEDHYFSPTFDAKTQIVRPFPTLVGNKEIATLGEESTAIYIFDHTTKSVTLYLKADGVETTKLPKYRPPGPNATTGRIVDF